MICLPFMVYLTILRSVHINSNLLLRLCRNRYPFHRNMATEVFSPIIPYSTPNSLSFKENSILSNFLPLYPPLIYHIVADKNWNNPVDMIHSETGLDRVYIHELIDFGAIYLSEKNNKSNGNNNYNSNNPSVQREGSNKRNNSKYSSSSISSGNSNSNNQYPNDSKEKISESIPVTRLSHQHILLTTPVLKDSYCRVHANPRRYFGGYNLDWNHRILLSSILPGIAVVNKPHDLPMTPTIDNRIENLLHYVQNHIHRLFSSHEVFDNQNKFYISSRLDACTSGLNPVPFTHSVASYLGKEIAKKGMKKVYKVVCKSPTPLPLGRIKHCFRRKNTKHSNAKPTLLRSFDEDLVKEPENKFEGKKWQDAELIILDCKEIQLSKHVVELLAKYDSLLPFKENSNRFTITDQNIDENLPPSIDKYYECDVELITGRTHQIRLQFAALNACILGDSRYEPVRGLLDEGDDTPWKDGQGWFGPEPRIIGLQCHRLTFTSSFIKNIPFYSSSRNESTRWIDSINKEICNVETKILENGDVSFVSPSAWWQSME